MTKSRTLLMVVSFLVALGMIVGGFISARDSETADQAGYAILVLLVGLILATATAGLIIYALIRKNGHNDRFPDGKD